MKIMVLGATGFVGRHLCSALSARGDEVVSASLRDPEGAARAAAGSGAVVNLAGASVSERWTPEHKREIERSRVDLPRAFIAALARSEAKPARYVSASAIGYYGTSADATFTESSPPGSDFLARVCVSWEREALRARDIGLQVAIVRTGIVLGADGGALAKLLPIFKLGLGGVVASGDQWYSWIHIADHVGILMHAIDGADGVFNATAPNPVKNRDFTAALGAAVHRPAFVPTPAFAIGLILGEGAVVVTEGQRVLPQATLASGYRFTYPLLSPALEAVVAAA
jgi:uncharacterized protein (TIGR01777 family)